MWFVEELLGGMLGCGWSDYGGKGGLTALIFTILYFVSFLSGQLSGNDADKEQKREEGESRKEGQWEVTPIGRCQDRLYRSHFFEGQHRLLLAIDSALPQLWDTQTGKRIAILSDQKAGVDSCAISPDGTKLLTADRLGGWRFFRDENEKKKKVVGGL